MNNQHRIGMYAALLGLCSSIVACSHEPISPSLTPGSATRSVAAATLTGRIVYTLSGNLRLYDVATRTDVALGVAGVNPKFSPDGTLVVYQTRAGISVMNSNGTNSRLVNASGGVPSFDPTGTMIAYNDNGIWKINVDGTGKTQLNADGRQPAWSPDGAQIAFHTWNGSSDQLFLMNADGSNRHQALSSGTVLDIVWTPSAKLLFGVLVERNNYEIHSYDPAVSTSLTRLTVNRGNDFEPSWSPDATGICFSSGSGGIWIMNADGSGLFQVNSKGRQSSWGR
ncbi:hypothetical protein BH11GEM1_BH11GEM1_31690 [soil metagenome]